MSLLNFISYPVPCIQGETAVPGDKSISHRALIFGAIAEGKTLIHGFLEAEDCLATLNAFRSMGAYIEGPQKGHLFIHGVGKQGLKKPNSVIDCGNSGTSMRLLAGLLAAQPFSSVLTGDESLLKRPMQRVVLPLRRMGARLQGEQGIHIEGGHKLRGIDYPMPEASAQVKSCLLLAGMYAQGSTRITESTLTRDHTERMLKTFSYPLQKEGQSIVIASEGVCQGTELQIPGDISSAAFLIVAATILPGSQIRLKAVGVNPTRVGVLTLLQQMGANILVSNQRQFAGEPVADLEVSYAPLHGIRISGPIVPLAIDEFPILCIAAACAEGETVLQGAEELAFKESNRITAVVEGLLALGIEAQAFVDGLSIKGGQLRSGTVDSKGDHRIAMSFAIAGTVASGPVFIKNCAAVCTSFPDFLSIANRLHCRIEDSKQNG